MEEGEEKDKAREMEWVCGRGECGTESTKRGVREGERKVGSGLKKASRQTVAKLYI